MGSVWGITPKSGLKAAAGAALVSGILLAACVAPASGERGVPLHAFTGETLTGPTGLTSPTGSIAPTERTGPSGDAGPTGPIDPTGPGGPVAPEPNPAGKPGRKNWVGLKVRVAPADIAARIGVSTKVEVSVRNIGDQLGRRIRICPIAEDSLVGVTGCKLVKKLKSKHKATRTFRVRLRPAAADETTVSVLFRAKASKSKARSGKLTIRPIGR